MWGTEGGVCAGQVNVCFAVWKRGRILRFLKPDDSVALSPAAARQLLKFKRVNN